MTTMAPRIRSAPRSIEGVDARLRPQLVEDGHGSAGARCPLLGLPVRQWDGGSRIIVASYAAHCLPDGLILCGCLRSGIAGRGVCPAGGSPIDAGRADPRSSETAAGRAADPWRGVG